MKVALAQIACTPGDVHGNVAKVLHFIAAAAAAGSQLVVFPEMADTGYEMETILRCASRWDDDAGPFVRVQRAAREHRIAVAVGLSERTDEAIFNSVAVFAPDGEQIAAHRKTHLMNVEPVREKQRLGAGKTLTTFLLEGFRFGLVICYEVRFPEVSRALAIAGAEVLLVPAAFPHARREHWSVLTRARAIENQAYLFAVNRVGTDAGMPFAGRTQAYDPFGVVLAAGNETEEGLHFAELERESLTRVRSGLRVFDDRRPELY